MKYTLIELRFLDDRWGDRFAFFEAKDDQDRVKQEPIIRVMGHSAFVHCPRGKEKLYRAKLVARVEQEITDKQKELRRKLKLFNKFKETV